MRRSVGTLRGGGEAMDVIFDDSVSGYHELRPPACDRWLMLELLYSSPPGYLLGVRNQRHGLPLLSTLSPGSPPLSEAYRLVTALLTATFCRVAVQVGIGPG